MSQRKPEPQPILGSIPLRNQKHEAFSTVVASGESFAKAYVYCGYSGKGAAQSADKLRKLPHVAARIIYLQQLAAGSKLAESWLNRTYVLTGLKKVIEKAMILDKLGDANTALRLLGVELGMFTERTDSTFHWDGDPGSLDDAQLETLTYRLEEKMYGQDRAQVEAAKRKELAAVGGIASSQVIDIKPEDDTLEVEPDSHIVVSRRTWLSELERLEGIADRGAARAELRGLLPPGFRPPEGFMGMDLGERAAWLEANCPLPEPD